MRPHLRLSSLLVLAGGALLLGESAARAQQYYGPAYGPPPPPPPPEYYRPRYAAPVYYAPVGHNSLFLQLTAGVGYLTASETVGGIGYTYSGAGFTISGAMGGAIAPNLILYGEILGTSIVDANLSGGGTSGYSGYDMTLFGIGPGIAYYFEPVNVYLAGTLTLSKMFFSDTNTGSPENDTDWGVGAAFKAGKEWWVTPRWGLGLAALLHVATMKDPSADNNLTALTFAVQFSASFD
ncbi:MAG: hypothetical protein ABSB49_19975 [Polyangia bacterium]